MFIRDVMQARSELVMQREAVRLLNRIINRLDVVPTPDGKTRCRFTVDDAFLERLGVWASAESELEDDASDTDGTDDREDDGRGDEPVREEVPVAPIAALPQGPLLAEVGTVTAIVEAAREAAELAAA